MPIFINVNENNEGNLGETPIINTPGQSFSV